MLAALSDLFFHLVIRCTFVAFGRFFMSPFFVFIGHTPSRYILYDRDRLLRLSLTYLQY